MSSRPELSQPAFSMRNNPLLGQGAVIVPSMRISWKPIARATDRGVTDCASGIGDSLRRDGTLSRSARHGEGLRI